MQSTLRAWIALASLLVLAALLMLASPRATHADNIYYTYKLQWSAPGDDSVFGRATAYSLRYSMSPITEANWNSVIAFAGVPAPQPAGAAESFTIFGLDARYNYYVAMKTIDEHGNWSKLSNLLLVHTPQPLGTMGDSLLLALSSPWPNPANVSARFAFALPHSGAVEIDAFDISGRRVRSIARGVRNAGRNEVAWDLTDDRGGHVAPGKYLIRARLIDHETIKSLVVVR